MATKRVYPRIKNPGLVVGILGQQTTANSQGKKKPLYVFWAIDKYRKDYKETVAQMQVKPVLPEYSASLFDSMFRKWRDDEGGLGNDVEQATEAGAGETRGEV